MLPMSLVPQEVSADQIGDQVELYALAFGKTDGERVLPWRYRDSPHGASITLLTRDPDGQAVGGYACNGRRVLSHGEFAGVVGETGDVMTHSDHRGKGYFLDLDRRAMELARERKWPLVIGLPNSKSAGIFTSKLGWIGVGAVRPWTFVLHADEAARQERQRAGRLASMGTGWAAWRGSMRRGALRKSFFEKVNVVALPRFTSAVDDLLAQVAPKWAWLQERSAEFLNWRFIDAPSNRFRAHGVFAPNGDLVGYAVVQLPERGSPVGYVVDLLALDDVALAAAMEAALGHLHKMGASVARATAVEGSWWQKQLKFCGFRAPHTNDRKQIIVHLLDPSSPLAVVAQDPTSWYFTDADRDDETCS